MSLRTGDRELDQAGITDPTLRWAYARCRHLHRRHGRTYFLATTLLPPGKRPFVHALYGFARYADDLVDNPDPSDDESSGGVDPGVRLASLRAGLCGEAMPVMADSCPEQATATAVVRAVGDTVARFELDRALIADFLDAMDVDLHVTSYATYDDLAAYMWGSAAVIGVLLLPLLGTTTSVAIAAPYAADLGRAFQLTNFIRDVGEDAARGRVYLPIADLDAFGVSAQRLHEGVVDGPIRRLLAHEIARTRELYRAAEPGIRLLAADARDCVGAAAALYADILTEIEDCDYQVLQRRVVVPARRRARVGLPAAARALVARW